MGCTTSRDAVAGASGPLRLPSLLPTSAPRRRRLEDAANLCRERAKLARDVANRRCALAAAHAAYFRSLAAVGGALRRFVDAALAPPPSSPPAALPPSPVPAAAAASSPLSTSPPSSDEDRLDAPLPDASRGGGDGKAAAASPTPSSTTTTRIFMKNASTVPAVVYEDPYAPHRYAEGEASHGHVDGEEEAAPPSPPAEVTPWDFFDPFAHCDGFAEDYLSRRRDLPDDDSAELRRTEGVPELEEDTGSAATDASSRATAAGDENAKAETPAVPDNAASNSDPPGGDDKLQRTTTGPEPDPGGNGAVSSKDAAPSNGSSEKSKPEGEEEKKKNSPAILKDTGGGEPGARPAATTTSPARSVAAAMDEVYWLFNEAANRGVAVARVLGKGRSKNKAALLPCSCRAKLRVLTTTVPTMTSSSCLPKRQQGRKSASSRRRSTSSSSLLGAAGRSNVALRFSSTLDKIWVWENKLCREIEDKKKLRKQYKKKYEKLKTLGKRGAESSTIDSTQGSLNVLRSKISVSISTANVLKVMIQKVRDEELYPQLADHIQRFRALWKAVLECHEKQLSAIQDTEIHRLKAVTLSQSSVASIASEELERELKNWRRCFDKWTGSQKSFVEALNRWMMKRLPEAQEETRPDGITQQPEPPALVISKNWLQATESASMVEVMRSMDHFCKLVHEFKKSQEGEQRRKQKAERASRDYVTKREDLKAAYGLITGQDVTAVMENPYYKHDECVRNLVKARRRRDEERARHYEILQHAHVAASATLPLGLVPMLQQIISFFQGNMQAYTQIGIQGT